MNQKCQKEKEKNKKERKKENERKERKKMKERDGEDLPPTKYPNCRLTDLCVMV
jgi:hypothetical protein